MDLVLAIAHDAFPRLFEPHPSAKPTFSPPVPTGIAALQEIWGNPRLADLAAAINDDPDLSTVTKENVQIGSSLGLGWPADARSIGTAVITTAAETMVAKGEPTDDMAVFEREIVAMLQTVRALVRGETRETFSLLGFDGLALREAAHVELPWGRLRAAGPLDVGMGEGPPATCVLAVPTPVRFTIGGPGGPIGLENPVAAARAVRLLPTSALLGIQRSEPVVVAPVWMTSITPGASGRGGWTTARREASFSRFIPYSPRTGGAQLSTAEEADLISWARMVEQHHHDSINVALDRIRLALLERSDSVDALIDAVIALENLFGHATGGVSEVKFRVTSAATLLLESNRDRRDGFRKTLGRVYDARSTVIHGSDPDRTELEQQKELAISTVIDVLRVLFSERPHLLADRERGLHLILGTADPREA